MCLYDLKAKRKISENFSFDLNTDSAKQMLHTHQTHQDQSTLAKSCILNVTYPSPDLFVVIRIEKVLQQGDISECVEPYMKTQSQSGLEKLQANASQFCERLGKYRMPFVWTAVNVMSLLNNNTNSKADVAAGNTPGENSSSLQQKSASLDRRFVKSPERRDRDGNESGDELTEGNGSKNAYEALRKTGGSGGSELNKRNSLVNCSTNGTGYSAAPCAKNNSFNGELLDFKFGNFP